MPGMPGMRMGRAPNLDAHTILFDWQLSIFPIVVTVVLIALALWYLRAVGRLGRRGRQWPTIRTMSFLGALAAVVIALGSSVATLSMYSFSAHVIQHLLLMIIAPPLAALGAPMTLLQQTSARPTKTLVLRVLHSRAFAVLRHPVPVFFLYYLSMYVFFLSSLLGYAMDRMWLMDLINLTFLLGATLFWWPMVGVDPIPGGRMPPAFKLLNLLIGVPIESFLGVAILMKATPVAPIYSLASSHTGGGLLWVATEIATLAALLPIYLEWTRADARTAKRVDARLAAGGALEAPRFDGHGLASTLRALRRD